MRIGAIFDPQCTNRLYRAFYPLRALEERGHEVVFAQPDRERFEFPLAPLRGCDVVYVYRRSDPAVLKAVDELRKEGAAIVWDNDDDIRFLPDGIPRTSNLRGLSGQRSVRETIKIRNRADLVTTTTAVLARLFQEDCACPVEVVENFVSSRQIAAPRAHEGFVIGWVGRGEHMADARALRISSTLRAVIEKDPRVRIETIGPVRLDLPASRYSRIESVPFEELPVILSGWDLGVAPIADIPMSYARSNIKVKEYASASVPWLASARGPYVGLESRCGGLLVADDAWESTLLDVIGSRLRLRLMRRRAQAWAKRQRVELHVERWEQIMQLAMAEASARRPAGLTRQV